MPTSIGHLCRRIVVIASLSSWRWRCCGCCDGVLLPLRQCCHSSVPTRRRCHRRGVIAPVALALLPSLQLWRWCPCGHSHDTFATVSRELLPSRRWRPCCAGTVAIVARHRAGVLACCDGHHRRLGAGAIFMSRWHRFCGRGAGVVVVLASSSRWHHCHHSVDIVAVAVMASLRLTGRASSPTWRWRHPLLRWRHCHHRSAGALVVVAIGIIAVTAWVQLPLLRWRR